MKPPPRPRLSTPAPMHNALLAPGVCLCVDCCRIVLTLRCPVVIHGQQCGVYRHRGTLHTLIPATIWRLCEERVRLDGR